MTGESASIVQPPGVMVMHWPVSVPMSAITVPPSRATRRWTGWGSSSAASPSRTLMQSDRAEPLATLPVRRRSDAPSFPRRLCPPLPAKGTATAGPRRGTA